MIGKETGQVNEKKKYGTAKLYLGWTQNSTNYVSNCVNGPITSKVYHMNIRQRGTGKIYELFSFAMSS